jgi:hypothetical protein
MNGRSKKLIYNILAGKCEGKRPPGKLSRERKNNIKLHLRKIGREDVE